MSRRNYKAYRQQIEKWQKLSLTLSIITVNTNGLNNVVKKAETRRMHKKNNDSAIYCDILKERLQIQRLLSRLKSEKDEKVKIKEKIKMKTPSQESWVLYTNNKDKIDNKIRICTKNKKDIMMKR